MSEATLLQSIRNTFDNLPVEAHDKIDTFTEDYPKNWFGPHILTTDLGDIFGTAMKDIQTMAVEAGVSVDDERNSLAV